MKNFYKKIFALAFAVMIPITFFLSACGLTSTTTVRGVSFVSELYDDETGYAVFEVDLNEPTKLEYKAYPSTWSGYAVTYTTVGSSGENRTIYLFENGVITVYSSSFQEIQVSIHIGSYEDTCIIRLKTYPTSIYTESEVTLNACGVYTIPVYGVFSDGERTLSETEYNFLVESDDPTVIEVPNSSRLTVYSIRSTLASANVTITLLDTKGNPIENISVSITITITPNASTAYARLGTDYDDFVMDGDTVSLDLSDLTEIDTNVHKLSISLFVFSSSGIYTETDISCTTSNGDYAAYDEENGYLEIYLKGSDFSVSGSEISLDVTIWTPLIDDESQSFSLTFTIVFTYSQGD